KRDWSSDVCSSDLGLDEEPYKEKFNPSYNICDCCGFEYGYSEDHDVDLGYIVVPNEMKTAAFQLYRKCWIEEGASVYSIEDFPNAFQKNGKVKPEIVINQLKKLNLDISNFDFLDDY